MLLEGIGTAWTFWIYMAMWVLAFVFIWRLIPETERKTPGGNSTDVAK